MTQATIQSPEKQIPVTIETSEDAVMIANEITRLEAVVKQMKDNLKAYVDKNGAVKGTGTIWDYSESVSWKIHANQFQEVLQLIALEGMNPWEMISLPKAQLDKLGWSESELEKYAERNVSRRFGSKKA